MSSIVNDVKLEVDDFPLLELCKAEIVTQDEIVEIKQENISRSQSFCFEQEDVKFKSEIPTSSIETQTNQEVFFDEWNIKKEEVELDDDFKQNDTRTQSLTFEQEDVKLQSEISTIETQINHEIFFDGWNIKKEEVELDGDFEQNGTSVPSHYFGLEEDKEKVEDELEKRSRKNAKAKIKRAMAVKKFKCHQCDYASSNKGHLNRHLLTHKDPKDVNMLECGECEYKTFRPQDLERHLIRHKNPENVITFHCDQCTFKTARKDSLMSHEALHKKEKITTFKCELCSFKTHRKWNLNLHILRHENLENAAKFKCDKCDYKTVEKNSLKVHQIRHKKPEEVDVFKCYHCDFQTFYRKNIQVHLLRHRNPRRDEYLMMKCYHCDFQTFYRQNMQKHLLRHRNPRQDEDLMMK